METVEAVRPDHVVIACRVEAVVGCVSSHRNDVAGRMEVIDPARRLHALTGAYIFVH